MLMKKYPRNKGWHGRFAIADDAPRYMADGLGPGPSADQLRQRAATVQRQAFFAGSAQPARALRAIAALRFHTDKLEWYAVAHARSLGWSWEDIGQGLGLSKQTVHKRYARLIAPARAHRARPSRAEARKRRRPR